MSVAPDRFLISTDQALLDLDAIYTFLSTCYWSPGIARERLERAIRHSLCFAAYDTQTARPGAPAMPSLAGFARIITDRATFAYLCDVFVLEPYRRQGLATRLVQAAIDHPALQGIRRFCLFTRDAHAVYAPLGFCPMPDALRYMERLDRESYTRP